MSANFSSNNFLRPNTVSQPQPVFDSFGDEKQRLAEGYDDVVEELSEKWKKENAGAQIFPETIAMVHPEVLDFLLEFERVSEYDEIAKQTGLDAQGRDLLGHIVWKIAQTKKFGEIANEVSSQVALASSANLISQLLEQKIISKIVLLAAKPITERRQSEAIVKKDSKLPLSQAMSQYPKLGEQSITSNPLKLRYFPTPVRSSIKNWITDYHDALGAGKHSTIDRGNYLFHSENGKRLTPAERQKMSLVLKSLDEETLLDIDVDRQAIVFEVPKPLPFSENSSSVGVSNSSNFSANANPEEIAQARIRQSLNFSNSQNATAGKNQDAPVFVFEDSDYANVLRAKNSTGAESTFGNFASEKKPEVEKPAFGSLSFSSAQELPVEKKFVAPAQNSIAKFSMPAQQAKIEPPKAPQTWNSPDLRQQSSFVAPTPPAQPIQTQPAPAPAQSIQTQPVQAQLNKIESVQAQSNQIHAAQVSAPEKKPTQPTGPIVLPRNYSPYVISPSHRANNSAQNEPKIQGNTVDLS